MQQQSIYQVEGVETKAPSLNSPIQWENLEHAEREALQREFKEFDMDNNGLLSRAEVKHIVEKRQQAPVADDDINEFFSQYDMDKDDQVSWNEFVQVSLAILNHQVQMQLQHHKQYQSDDEIVITGGDDTDDDEDNDKNCGNTSGNTKLELTWETLPQDQQDDIAAVRNCVVWNTHLFV